MLHDMLGQPVLPANELSHIFCRRMNQRGIALSAEGRHRQRHPKTMRDFAIETVVSKAVSCAGLDSRASLDFVSVIRRFSIDWPFPALFSRASKYRKRTFSLDRSNHPAG